MDTIAIVFIIVFSFAWISLCLFFACEDKCKTWKDRDKSFFPCLKLLDYLFTPPGLYEEKFEKYKDEWFDD